MSEKPKRKYGLDYEAIEREEREFDAACPWKVNPETLVLYIDQEGDRSYYELDLERFTSSAAVLDSIAQVSGKPWLDDAAIGALVRKLDRIFNLQGSFCSGGRDHEFDASTFVRKKYRPQGAGK